MEVLLFSVKYKTYDLLALGAIYVQNVIKHNTTCMIDRSEESFHTWLNNLTSRSKAGARCQPTTSTYYCSTVTCSSQTILINIYMNRFCHSANHIFSQEKTRQTRQKTGSLYLFSTVLLCRSSQKTAVVETDYWFSTQTSETMHILLINTFPCRRDHAIINHIWIEMRSFEWMKWLSAVS